MAQSLNFLDRGRGHFFLVTGLASIAFFHVAAAQSLPDPTRPPALLIQTSANLESLAGPVLQSILIAPDRHVAIINGQTVMLNGKYGDQTLVRMSESEVVLRSGKELQTLKLFPDFEKKSSQVKPSLKTNTPRP